MKTRLLVALAILLSTLNFVQPASAQSISFTEYYNILPSGNYCDTQHITFQYDRSYNFSFSAGYTYYIKVKTVDSVGNIIDEAHWETTGWTPSGAMTESASFQITFANEGGIRLSRRAAYYEVEYGYSFTSSRDQMVVPSDLLVMEWHININCDLSSNQTYDAQFTLDYVLFP